jgi:DNA-binding NtrC family response regulator
MCAHRSEVIMQTQRPQLLVVDDDRAVLTLVGTGITCLDILRTLRGMNPQCEAVLTTGYDSLDAAVDALKHNLRDGAVASTGRSQEGAGVRTVYPASLVDVERDHIIRTLEQVRGNKAVAARILGVSRRAFYRQLERHGLHQRIPMGRRSENVTLAAD